jgi:hypothetical protein
MVRVGEIGAVGDGAMPDRGDADGSVLLRELVKDAAGADVE